jgi:hypothetical protein
MGAPTEASSRGYSYKSLGNPGDGKPFWHSSSKVNQSLKNSLIFMAICAVFFCTFTMLSNSFLMLVTLGGAGAAKIPSASAVEKVPQYFQTSPELWAGPTATGRAPFLAQTNPVSFAPTVTFVPNTPLETAQPIVGQGQNQSIFQLMGQLSPYFPNPSGFGVAEYPLPPGANITHVQVSVVHSRECSVLIICRCFQDMDLDIPRLELMSIVSDRRLPITLTSLTLRVNFPS